MNFSTPNQKALNATRTASESQIECMQKSQKAIPAQRETYNL
jgi:hypothetical protein